MSFLEQIADHVVGKHRDHLDKLTIIFPNIRAGVFLSNYIIDRLNSTSWLPEIISSKEFSERTAGLKSADDYVLLTLLYDAFKENGSNTLTFKEFLNWGTMLLRDFREMDQQLADTSKLFTQLSDVRELEMWNIEQGGQTEFQRKYLEFSATLEDVYNAFTSKMELRGIGHSGFIERKAAGKIQEANVSPDTRFIIAGFNALTKAEFSIFSSLRERFETEFFWDYDKYYLENELHEAGHFARVNMRKMSLNPVHWIGQHFEEIQKNVNIYQCSNSTEQALFLTDLLSDVNSDNGAVQTAIVLPEESALIPVLQYLPENISKVNVTMGYSLMHSPYYNLFESILHFYNQPGNTGKQTSGFYHRYVTRFLTNNSLRELLRPHARKLALELRHEIVDRNMIYIPLKRLNELFEKDSGIRFEAGLGVAGLLDLLERFLYSFDVQLSENDNIRNKMHRAFLKHHADVLNSVREIVENPDLDADWALVSRMWKHYSELSKIQFTGEPLSGLQIMGLLETRNLDFDHVIILNVNEGILPSRRNYASFIPNDIKRQNQMLLHRDKEAVFAYHFYRLMQRSKKIDLLYTTQMDALGGGEVSRFILQLKNELKQSNTSHQIKETVVQAKRSMIPTSAEKVRKSSPMLKTLEKYGEKGFSPSSLSTYLDCPLDFYYKYVVGLREKEEIEELVEADVLGNILHHTLHKLYKPLIGKTLDQAIIKNIQSESLQVLTGEFETYFPNELYLQGKNKLSYHLAQRFLNRFFDQEIKRVEENQIRITALEEDYSMNITLSNGLELNLRGKVDRVENCNGEIHVIDYKTGSVNSKDVETDEIEEVFSGNKNKLLQLLTYGNLIQSRKEFSAYPIKARIYAFKAYSQGFFDASISKENVLTNEILTGFQSGIRELLDEIFNPEIPFEHKPGARYCIFC